MVSDSTDSGFLKLLEVGSEGAFKIWRLSRTLRAVSLILGVAALLGLYYLARWLWDRSLFELTGKGVVIFVGFAALAMLFPKLMRVVRWRKTLAQIPFLVGAALAGWAVVLVHLNIFDKMFLDYGSRKNFDKL